LNHGIHINVPPKIYKKVNLTNFQILSIKKNLSLKGSSKNMYIEIASLSLAMTMSVIASDSDAI